MPLWLSIEHQFQENWPRVNDFNSLVKILAHRIPFPIQFVSQKIGMKYEQEIIQHGAIPMREASWHDFFNNLTWLCWGKIKSAILQIIAKEAQNQTNQRTSRQNLLAHFDECGLILCCSDDSLITEIKNYQWKSFFYKTQHLEKYCYPILVGHGMLEKALNPYIGMTAKAIFLKVTPDFFQLPLVEQFAFVDTKIADYILSESFPCDPKFLQPFPLLGWPKWHPDNIHEHFYDNEYYFRKKRFDRKAVDVDYGSLA